MRKKSKKEFKRVWNIRYFKCNRNYENNLDLYTFTVNKRFVSKFTSRIIFDLDIDILTNALTENYHATKTEPPFDYFDYGVKYTFTSKKDVKDAVEWLKTLLVAKQMCQ